MNTPPILQAVVNSMSRALAIAVTTILPILPICFWLFTCIILQGCDRSNKNGDSLYWVDKIEKSKEVLKDPSLSNRDRSTHMLQLARAYSGLGDKQKATDVWQDIINSDWADAVGKGRAHYELAFLREQRQDWHGAIEHYKAYVRIYKTLSEKEQEAFNGLSEEGNVVQYHIGEILEYRCSDVPASEAHYLLAVEDATTHHRYNRNRLVLSLADFYMRHDNWNKALPLYQDLARQYRSDARRRAIAVTEPIYKTIRCLVELGRREEAEIEWRQLETEWGDTKSELNQQYVQQARELMKKTTDRVESRRQK